MTETRRYRRYIELVADPLYKEYALPNIPELSKIEFNRRLLHLLFSCDQASDQYKWDNETKLEESHKAVNVLCDIRDAMHPEPDAAAPTELKLAWEKDRRRLWVHRDLQVILRESRNSLHGYYVNKELLLDAVGRYLKYPWMQDRHLDWMLCDAFVFNETYRISNLLKEELVMEYRGESGVSDESIGVPISLSGADVNAEARKHFLRRLRNPLLLAGGLIGTYVVLMYYNETSLASFIGALVISGFALDVILSKVLARFFPYRYQRVSLQHCQVLWNDVRRAYASFAPERFPLNPGLIKEKLLAAIPKGAEWDGAVFALLERAIQQDPVVWNCMGD
jgi:hypothetical protein